jgi:hypothetical protein
MNGNIDRMPMKKLIVCLAFGALALAPALQAGNSKTSTAAKSSSQATKAACAESTKDCSATSSGCCSEKGEAKFTKKTFKPANTEKGATLLAKR